MDVFGEHLVHGLVTVGRLGDDLEVGLGIEDRPQPFEHDGVVFGDQDAGLQWDRLDFRAKGDREVRFQAC